MICHLYHPEHNCDSLADYYYGSSRWLHSCYDYDDHYYDYDDYYDDDADYYDCCSDNATFAHCHMLPRPLARCAAVDAAAALDLIRIEAALNCTLPDVWVDVSYCDVPQLASADTCHTVGPMCRQLSAC